VYHKTDHRLNKQIHDLQKIKIQVSLWTIIGYSILYFLLLPVVVAVSERYNSNIILYLYLSPLVPVIAISYLLFTGKLSLLIKILHTVTSRRRSA